MDHIFDSRLFVKKEREESKERNTKEVLDFLEESIKDLASQAGFIVTRNMEAPVDSIEHQIVEARSKWLWEVKFKALKHQHKNYTHFSFYKIDSGYDYVFVRCAFFNGKKD